MNNKYIVCGDVHADVPSRFEHPKGNYILDCCVQTLNHIISYGEEHKIERYIFLGDIFERKDRIPNRLKNKIIDVFKRLSKYNVKIIEGNHDREGFDLSIKFLEPYAEIVDKPMLRNRRIFLPYTRYTDDTAKILKLSDEYDIIFGHFEIKGCSYGGIKRSDSGISPDIFKGKTVIAGHIHRFQEISDGIYHLGSIYQTDWGEQNEKKYFCVIDGSEILFKKLPTLVNRVTLEYGDESAESKLIVGSFNMARVIYESRAIDIKDVIIFKDKLAEMGFDNILIEPFNTQMSRVEEYKSKSVDSIYSKFVRDSLEEIKNISQRVLYREIINEVMEDK